MHTERSTVNAKIFESRQSIWPSTELNGRKEFRYPTPKIWEEGFVAVVVVPTVAYLQYEDMILASNHLDGLSVILLSHMIINFE